MSRNVSWELSHVGPGANPSSVSGSGRKCLLTLKYKGVGMVTITPLIHVYFMSTTKFCNGFLNATTFIYIN